MSFLTPPLPSSPSSPWKYNRRNKSGADQDFDRSISGSESEHEDVSQAAQPTGIDIDPGKKKIFGVSLSIAAPQPALRKIKYKVDKKDASKDKVTAKQLLLNTRLSATVASIEEEKKKDSIIAEFSQRRASEIAQNIEDKRDKEEKYKYGRGRHRTFKKIWTPHPRSKIKRPKSRSRSGSRGRLDKRRAGLLRSREPFTDWATMKAASPSYHEEYRQWREQKEKKEEKNKSKGKLPKNLDEIKPVFDLTDSVNRPRSLLAYAQEGSSFVSYPLINVHFTETEPMLKWATNPKSDKVFLLTRKMFSAHASREQLELFSLIADSSGFEDHQNEDSSKTEREWYPDDEKLLTYLTEPGHSFKFGFTSTVDDTVAAAKRAKEEVKNFWLKKTEEDEVPPPQPAPFLSSFKPVIGTETISEEPKQPEEPQELVTEYEEFLKMVSDKDKDKENDSRNINNDWDSESDAEQPPEPEETAKPVEIEKIEQPVPAIVPEQIIEPVEVNPPVIDVPVVRELQLNVDTLGTEFQQNMNAPEEPVREEETQIQPTKKIKKKKTKKLTKKKKKYESSSSDSDSSDSSDSAEENKKKHKKKKRKTKKRKKSTSSTSSSSDSETDKKKRKKKSKKNVKELEIAQKLLLDLQIKKQEIMIKMADLEHVTDKKTKKSLAKSLEDENNKIDQLEKLLLGQGKKKDKKKKKSKNADSSSSDSESDAKKSSKKKNKKKKSKKDSSSSDSSDAESKSRKKKRSKKSKTKKEKLQPVDVPKNDENVDEVILASRKRPAEDDIAPVTPKTMFLDFAARLPLVSSVQQKEDSVEPARSVRDVTNTLQAEDNVKNNEWDARNISQAATAVAAAVSDAAKRGIAQFRAFQAISAAQPPKSAISAVNTTALSTQDLYSPGASESEASRSVASPHVAPHVPSQVHCSDSQTSTSFFNVPSAEESQQPPKTMMRKSELYCDDELLPPGMEPIILEKPAETLKYSYDTGGLLESSDEKGSDMSMDEDKERKTLKSKIKSLKMETKLKSKPAVMVYPTQLLSDDEKDIPDEFSNSPSHKKQPKAPMTVETVFYQDSDSDEEDTRPPRLDFTELFAQRQEEAARERENDRRDRDYDGKGRSKKDKRDRRKSPLSPRRKSQSPRRLKKTSRSPDRRAVRRSPEKREAKRLSRSPERRRRRTPSPKRRFRSPSPRRRRKDSPRQRRSWSRSRSHSPRSKRMKRRSRSRSPRRGDSPRKRSMHSSEMRRSATPPYHPDDVAGRIPVIGTTIPAPMPGGIFPGEENPNNGATHRLSLDQRIELELGHKMLNTPPPGDRQSCYYPQTAAPYNVSRYPYAPGTVVQVGNMMEVIPNSNPVIGHGLHHNPQQTNIVQVGNVLQVVPLARATAIVAPTPVAQEPATIDISQNPLIKAFQAERERRKKEKEARKAEREARRKERQAKRDAKHMTIAEKLKLSNSLIADLIDMKAERNEGLVLGQDMEDEELLLEALAPPSPPGNLEVVEDMDKSITGKSILIKPSTNKDSVKKNVKFADGLVPGEESESEGDADAGEKAVPKPIHPKEKRFKKKIKKKIKVQVVRHTPSEPEEIEEEDDLPPPSPPPGDPPPILYASFPFGGQVQYPVYQIGSTGKAPLTSPLPAK